MLNGGCVEDFRTPWAEFFLARYRQKVCMFNDDIQGTGTMVLAAILASLRAQGKKPKQIAEQRIVCLGKPSFELPETAVAIIPIILLISYHCVYAPLSLSLSLSLSLFPMDRCW
jgi:hypothetical protein